MLESDIDLSVQVEPAIEPGNEDIVHHVIVYQCSSSVMVNIYVYKNMKSCNHITSIILPFHQHLVYNLQLMKKTLSFISVTYQIKL